MCIFTGTKCISKNEMSDRGDILNDSHAEIMCRRGFIRYLYEQINFAISSESSIFAFNHNKKKFEIIESISFHLFSTHSPCGDASIFAIDSDEPPPIKKPKHDDDDDDSIGHCVRSIAEPAVTSFTGAKIIYDNVNVAQDLMVQSIGNVRTKPGRGEPTLSMSCSDKMAKWNILGLQGALIQQFIDKPIHFKSLTFCNSNFCDINATERALWKRFPDLLSPMTVMKPIIRIAQTTKFKYEKNDHLDPSPSSIVWCKVKKCPQQVAVAGKRQGITKKMANKRNARLLITKIELFREYLEILKKFNHKMDLYPLDTNFEDLSYTEAKRKSQEYEKTWSELKGNYFKVWTVKRNELQHFKID